MEPKKPSDPDQLGEWRINGRLGEGGFGTVYLAEQGAQKAAVKVIRQEILQEDDARDRLVREAKALSMLSDSFIARILDSDLMGEIPWIATEFVNGPTLETRIKYDGVLPEIEWFRLAANIFHALLTAHQFGITHKDIKPSNIILGETGNKLIDFGIAHISEQSRKINYGDLEGSIPFCSPEHFTPNSNPKMDVFSTAATLAFAAKGSSIWQGENDLQVMRSINDDLPNLEGLSENQKRFLLPLLEKSPSERLTSHEAYQNALVFVEYLVGNTKKPLLTKRKSRIGKILDFKMAVVATVIILLAGLGANFIFKDLTLKLGEIKSLIVGDSRALTSEQTKKVSSCQKLVASDDYTSALVICRETALAGHSLSQYLLGYALYKSGNIQEGTKWVARAAEKKLPDALSWMAYEALRQEKFPEALSWAQNAADAGDLEGVRAMGYAYAELGQYDLAAEWYEKAWKLGDGLGLINLGYHFRFVAEDKIQAEKWLKLAAQTKTNFQSQGAFDYAEFLWDEKREPSVICPWYKKAAEAGYKDGQVAAVDLYKKRCLTAKLPPSPIMTPAPKKLNFQSASPSSSMETPQPSTSNNEIEGAISSKPRIDSDQLSISAPLAEKVLRTSIFGRVFKDSSNFWRIILTNSANEKVPDITAIQFRMIGYTGADWMNVPYKLKLDPTFGNVYAQVDDFLFSVIFKERKYCPEFRAVKEKGGQIVQIWEKGQPECSSDYNP